MFAWSDDGLVNGAGQDRHSLLNAAPLGAPVVAAAQRVRPSGVFDRAARLALRDDPVGGPDARAVAGVRRALQAGGLKLTGAFRAPMHQVTQYRDPRAYQAYVEEMVCLP